MKIFFVMGIKVLRIYNVELLYVLNVVVVIDELKKEDFFFEMYVMLGVWIDCKGVFIDNFDYNEEDVEVNVVEI